MLRIPVYILKYKFDSLLFASVGYLRYFIVSQCRISLNRIRIGERKDQTEDEIEHFL